MTILVSSHIQAIDSLISFLNSENPSLNDLSICYARLVVFLLVMKEHYSQDTSYIGITHGADMFIQLYV